MNAWPAVQSIDAREEPESERHCSAYERLRSALIRYEFKPGERLMIADLALRFGVSPTPIREALSRLREEMLIEFVPGRGYFCPAPDLKVLSDLYRALAHLLVVAADDVLGQTATEEIDRIVAAFDARGDIDGNPPEVAAHARARLLEQALGQFVALSGNLIFSQVLENILARTHFVRCLMLESPERFKAAKTALHQLQEALRQGDREIVKRLILSDCGAQVGMLPGLIKELLARRCIDSLGSVMSKSA